MIAFQKVAVRSDTAQSHADFLPIKEVIERYAGVAFRNRPETEREEAVAEAVAAAFVNFLSLKRRGKYPAQFPSVVAVRAIQRVRAERHVGSGLNSRDVFSKTAAERGCFQLQQLPQAEVEWQEALIDNAQTPVLDQVCFRCDFPAWLSTLARRHRGVAQYLALGHSTGAVAKKFGLSPGRVSQLRRELHLSWMEYQDEILTESAS